MWANAQRDGRPAKYRWRPVLNAANRRKCIYIYIYSLPAQVRAKQCERFGWLPLSDVAAVTKPRRETS